ncbi:MAG: group III truncated hemoglobin [Candidatus Sericytochromatia bacterium]
MKKDIENIEDIKKLVNNFYIKVVPDEVIGWIFEDVMQTDWTYHLPKMYDFWESVIFGTVFDGNPIQRHIEVNQEVKLLPDHFQQWELLFIETVDEYFIGEKAELAKSRAKSISKIIQNKISFYQRF